MQTIDLAAQRQRDYAAFLKNTSALTGGYEMRDGPDLADVQASLDNIQEAFEKFKEKNDERLKQIEQKGSADAVTTDELAKISAEMEKLKDTKSQLEKLMKIKERVDEMELTLARPGGLRNEQGEVATQEEIDHVKAFKSFLREPDNHERIAELRAKHVAAVQSKPGIDQKTVSTLTDSAGGYAVPEIISSTIDRLLKDISPMRQMARVISVGSKDYKELVDVHGNSYAWVGEDDTRNATNTPGLEEVAPTFGTIMSYPEATEESLDDIFFNVEQWIISSAVEGFAEGEGIAFVNGNGTKKPTGFLNGTPVVDADGARDFGDLQFVPTGAAAAFNASDPLDAFKDVIYSLKKGYRRNAMWSMNRATLGALSKFKDGDGNYLWQPSNIAGQPDSLLGYPIMEDEEMDDVAAGAFPVAFGDFRAGYLICDLVGQRITRDEITKPGYVKFYMRKRVGGILKKDEAIKVIKVATAS